MDYFTEKSFSRVQWIINKKSYGIFRLISFLMVLAINLIYFIFDRKYVKDNKAHSVLETPSTEQEIIIHNFLVTFEFIYMIVSSIGLIMWGYIYLPIISMKNWDIQF